ncbi:TPA: hypothetical protein RQM99_002939 [Aeromonas dhakensis]|nr:hypothetical protein [Aeromonas dhakensis]
MESQKNKKAYDMIREVINGNDIVALKRIYDESRTLIVIFNGAINREIRQPPVFQRNSWLEHIPHNVLLISDGTVEINDSLELGWYMGKAGSDYHLSIATLVSKIAQELNIDNESIIFYGSSGGGYASIILSTLIIGSRAISINAQFILSNYEKKDVYNKFIHDTGHDVTAPHLNAINYMMYNKYIPRMTVIQNKADSHHYRMHFKPFLAWYIEQSEKISSFGEINIEEFNDKKGHNAVPDKLDLISRTQKNSETTFLVASNEIENAPTIHVLTTKFRLHIEMSDPDDRLLIFIKDELPEIVKNKLLDIGWMISSKAGICTYIRCNKASSDNIINLSIDYLAGLKVGIINWHSKLPAKYKILSQ